MTFNYCVADSRHNDLPDDEDGNDDEDQTPTTPKKKQTQRPILFGGRLATRYLPIQPKRILLLIQSVADSRSGCSRKLCPELV